MTAAPLLLLFLCGTALLLTGGAGAARRPHAVAGFGSVAGVFFVCAVVAL